MVIFGLGHFKTYNPRLGLGLERLGRVGKKERQLGKGGLKGTEPKGEK